MSKKCYTPVKGIDDVLAQQLNSLDKFRIANLRGRYEEEGKSFNYSQEDLKDQKTLEKATKELIDFKKELDAEYAKTSKAKYSYADDLLRVRENFSATELNVRTDMIAKIFSNVITRIRMANPQLSRKQIANGIKVNGEYVAGQENIFKFIYANLNLKREKLWEAGDPENVARANKLTKVLENWDSLVSIARRKIKSIEDIKLGNRINFVDDTTDDNYGANSILAMMDPETMTKEGWQESSELKSAFSEKRKEVKNALSMIPKIEGSIHIKDDLGFEVSIDAMEAHNILGDVLRGVSSEENMMKALKSNSDAYEWMDNLYQMLEKNPTLRTMFYTDFNNNFQPYSVMKDNNKNGNHTLEFYIKNQTENVSAKKFKFNMLTHNVLNKKKSLYDEKGNVVYENVRSLIKLVKDNFSKDGILSKSKFIGSTLSEKKKIIRDVLDAFGIEASESDITTLAKRKAFKFERIMKDLNDYGFNKIFKSATFENELMSDSETDFEESKKEFKDFKSLFSYKPSFFKDNSGLLESKIGKLLKLVSETSDNVKLNRKARTKDAEGNTVTRYSDVTPSYMADEIEKIKAFVKNEDINGLRRYIESKYLTSKFFKYNDRILNRWLRDLYKGDISEKSFLENLEFDRFLGEENKNTTLPFENFTSKKHALSVMGRFYSDFTSNSNSFAFYPVFILGDSGVSKFIKAPKYSHEDIVDGLYDVYLQERISNQQKIAAAEKMYKQGILKVKENSDGTLKISGGISNFFETVYAEKDKNGNIVFKSNLKFSLLPFLNKDFKDSNGEIGKYAKQLSENSNEETVKSVIESYLEDAVDSFESEMINLGVLETNSKGEYVYFKDTVKNYKNNKHEMLRDFYENYKFATIQQLQFFTMTNDFYFGTKDLQKRYKEIHAPGKKLSLLARDFKGNYYNEIIDGKSEPERCVYFKDIEVNAEHTDPGFMEAIAYNYGLLEAPAGATREEIIEIGKKTGIYKKYLKNTLTDGQGYRTLDSYRKVKGMLGNWTLEMEDAYNYIMNIRAKGKDYVMTEEELKTLSEKAVIFQPIKPYLYSIENYPLNNEDILKIPVQHKYAEAVLIPELLPKGSKLQQMAYWMIEHTNENGEPEPIDMICSTKAVKVGIFGETEINEKQSDEDFISSLDKGYIHRLNYGDYREQTNVPFHVNEARLIGTQFKKLIISGINLVKDYSGYVGNKLVNIGGNHGKVRLTGQNLVSFYNSLVVANTLESFHQLEEELKTTQDISNILSQSVINNEREAVDNLLAYSLTGNDEFLIPLFEGSLEHDAAAMMLSIFKKRVNKQTMKGGSAVQVSAFGITGYEESGDLHYVTDPNNPNNILYAECEIPWDLTVTDASGNEIELDYNKYNDKDGNLIKDKDGIPLLEKDYPGILDMIAYRIPTERAYSMMNLKVVRFSNKMAGGTIKVPAQGTSIAGFDFDIDKLYFLRKSFKRREFSKEEIANIWKEIYTKHPEIKRALFNTRKKVEEAKEAAGILVKGMFDSQNVETQSILEGEKRDFLYTFWEEAGLEGTAAEFFSKYLKENNINPGFETYDFNKTPLENTKTARDNMFLEIARQRLMDEETFLERFTPGSFDNASKAARKMRELFFGELSRIITGKQSTQSESKSNIKFYDGNITEEDDAVFVFGSNGKSYNGNPAKGTGGAALAALQQNRLSQHENMANRFSSSGRAYGIQTVTEPGARKSLSEEEIIANIRDFYEVARKSGKTFKVAYRNTGTKTSLNGYSGDEMIDMFIKAGPIPSNVIFSSEWGKTGKFNTTSSRTEGTVDLNKLEEISQDESTDPEPNYDPSDPMTLFIYNQQNQVAGKLIGIFANQNTNHAFSSLMKTLRLNKPIEFAGHSESDFLHKDDKGKMMKVNTNVAELLAASVDAVKDPVLNFLNLNTITADAGATLMRLGYNAFEVGVLFNQPIIKDMCQTCFNDEISFNAVYNNIIQECEQKGIYLDKIIINPATDFSLEKLVSNIVKNRQNNNDYKSSKEQLIDQLKVLQLMKEVMDVSKQLSNFVTSLKFTASNSVGSTFGDLLEQQMKVNNYIESLKGEKKGINIVMEIYREVKAPINNEPDNLFLSDTEYMDKFIDNPFAFEQAMYDMNRKVLNLLSKYFPYTNSAYSNMREMMSNMTKYNFLDAETINTLHTDYLQFLLSSKEGSLFDGESALNDEDNISKREYFTEKFAVDLYKTIKDDADFVSKYDILRALVFDVDEKNNRITLKVGNIAGLEKYQTDRLTQSWEELYNNEETKHIAIGLFLYNFYNLGFTFSPMSFMNLAPSSLKADLKIQGDMTYTDFLNRIKDGKLNGGEFLNDSKEFAKLFILNHPENKKFVFRPFGKAAEVVKKLSKKNNIVQSTFTINLADLEEGTQQMFLVKDNKLKKGELAFVPAIYINNALYIASSPTGQFNVTSSTEMLYVKVNPLGKTNVNTVYPASYKSYKESLTTREERLKALEDKLNNKEIEVEETIIENVPSQEGDMDDSSGTNDIIKDVENLLNVDSYKDKITDALMNYGNNLRYGIENTVEQNRAVKENFMNSDNSDFIQTINEELSKTGGAKNEQEARQKLKEDLKTLIKEGNLKDRTNNKIC